jgi:arylsulfatase A-like enzyme/Tfp pilus assembly protein PilF
LDRIAEEGVVFEQAVSASPLTLPAHVSILTGKFPPTHGVRGDGYVLDEKEKTLAEHLKENGFETGGFVSAYALDSQWGVDQGFDRYFDDFNLTKDAELSRRLTERPANVVVDHALAWLDTVKSSRFFCWVHFNDPHAPYNPPEPFATDYANEPYLGEIAFTDSQLGRILNWLDEEQLTDQTIVVVAGDHGESLGDHGEVRHGLFVYDATVRVPLLIRTPYAGTNNERLDGVVRSVDILPTVLDLLRIRSSSDTDGESLVRWMTGRAEDLNLTAYSEALYPLIHYGWSELRSVRIGNFKYIEAPRPELYDLAEDPHEAHNIYTERSGTAEELRARLLELERRFDVSAPDSGPVEVIDPDTQDRLAELGYTGMFVSDPGMTEERSSRTDPKDKIEIYNLMLRAREASLDHPGSSDEAVQSFESVLSRDARIVEAWFMLGNEYFRRGELERAIETYARALELRPDYDLAVINKANAYRRLGDDDKAMAEYRAFKESHPENPRIRFEIAQILVDQEAFDEAYEELRAALALEPEMAAARNALGVLLSSHGDLEDAEREILTALEQNPELRYANHNLALIAEHRRDFQSAVVFYEKEIELYPRSHKSLFNFGRLQGYLGNGQAQIESYRLALEANPDFAIGYIALAQQLLVQELSLDEALELAVKGLELGPSPEYAPLGHYILADIYDRQGRSKLAARELAKGKALEARLPEK